MITNVNDFLEKSVKKFPNKIAFEELDKSISYKDFNETSKKVASKIIDIINCDFQRGVLIILPKGIDCLLSFFGVVKSGNFYTLLDKKTPKQRIEQVIEILKPKLLITFKDFPYSFDLPTIFTQDFKDYDINEEGLKLAKQRHIDTNLLYVFFTSGSTGIPKGVSIAHKSVIDYTFWVCETFKISKKDSFLNQSPFYFDNSILDIFSSIKMGACLHIVPTSLFAFPNKILQYIEDKRISTIFWVPSVLIYFANTNALNYFKLKSLKRVLFAAEIMPNKQLNIWRKFLPRTLFANLYGPTELTDICCYYVVDREFKDDELLPIGKACKNVELLVFDEDYKLITKPFVKGELLVRGTSLSLGYYNDEKRSKEAFIQNPLHNNFLDLCYKTGDIVAYNERGELLCYGRKDFQIKFMGHRIELGEIEIMLSSHHDIKNSACIFKNDCIYGFYESSKELNLKDFLRDKLPIYMIPRQFIRVEKFSLNANSKIDKKALNELV
ncbi:amino acid adenylation domain-containing protein [Campylobacter sp. LR185c]|uniref:AMP-binding protein n=1 Tax=Campylobacter sp. LR185c TaxID=2014525 RepID=UPI00123806B1|nr:AMP-binding protein [Campylobacter sp. LR185c]KAA6227443.1 amino acid adenylation domain-containing protein [Campylobacter sp. LR185c]KAA8603216.1 amino acid adenylation protein [Campylobacter sp. LR185c]